MEQLFEKDITNASFELLSRAGMLTWYLCEFIEQRGAEHVQAELVEERKTFAII